MNKDKAIEKIEKRFKNSRQKSYEAYLKAKEIIPAGVMSRSRMFYPYPLYISGGKGSKIFDLDENEIIDCAMGYGAMILGHSHPYVTESIREAAYRGSQFGIPHEIEYDLAKIMVDTIPSIEQITFCNSGSEAIYHAIRIVRAATGKNRIAKFEGGYHGGTNEVLANFKYNPDKGGPISKPNLVPVSIGIPSETQANTIILPYNNDAAFDIIKKNKDDIAIVLVEVIQGMSGCIIGNPDFILNLRKLTKDLNILLLADEVITGFRIGHRGGQDHYNIKADISTYGKIIGGGLPVGAIGGKESIMKLIASTGDTARDAKERVFYGGTFNGNLLTTAAGFSTVKYLISNPEIYSKMDMLGEKLRNSVNKFCVDENIPARMDGIASMFCTHFTINTIQSTRDLSDEKLSAASYFYCCLLMEGVFIPNVHMGFLSAAHDENDVDKIIEAHCNALLYIKELGLIK
jgi:glutamate-1-semialdehyde 2,1-aminomutase